MTGKSHDDIYRDFKEAVNMTPHELATWLESDDAKSVGYAKGSNKNGPDGAESTGHQSGRHIVEIAHKKKADLSDDDYAHMNKVVGYVHRHLAQKPGHNDDQEHSRWRFSLMNWGHDPLK